MTADSKHKRLLEALISKSSANEIEWKATPNTKVFKLSLRKGSLLLEQDVNSNLENLFIITLLNDRGEAVDSFNDEDFDTNNSRDTYKKMKNLYSEIARKVSGADALLDAFLLQIEDDIPF